jgi:hypothetical protein
LDAGLLRQVRTPDDSSGAGWLRLAPLLGRFLALERARPLVVAAHVVAR